MKIDYDNLDMGGLLEMEELDGEEAKQFFSELPEDHENLNEDLISEEELKVAVEDDDVGEDEEGNLEPDEEEEVEVEDEEEESGDGEEVEGDNVEDVAGNEEQESSHENGDQKEKEEEEEEEEKEEEYVDGDVLEEMDSYVVPPEMDAWSSYGLHPSLIRGLHELGFLKPTNVQHEALSKGMSAGNDVVGAAETGSGKTLAFGLPVLQEVLHSNINPRSRVGPYALIVCPTRELALQVTNHLQGVSKYCYEGHGATRQRVLVVSLVGGLSHQKQLRLLSRRPAIIVATPGRLWDLMSQRHGAKETRGERYAKNLTRIRCFVVDEADRMVEAGKFAEMQKILDLLPQYDQPTSREDRQAYEKNDEESGKKKSGKKESQKKIKKGKKRTADNEEVIDEADPEHWAKEVLGKTDEEIAAAASAAAASSKNMTKVKRHTFLFSATLGISNDAKRNLRKWRKRVNVNQLVGLERVLSMVDFHRHVEVLDLTTSVSDDPGTVAVASTIQETFLQMTVEEKDFYLYAFLRHYNKDRTIIFCNAITGVKRLAALLKISKMEAFALHANMQQRQRLKNLDRFKERENSILVTTDVAARGLDIPNVAHVIHFDVPHNSELYVHRSGRTGRAGKQGLSIVFVSPEDSIAFDRMRQQSKMGLTRFPFEVGYLPQAREIWRKVKEIDLVEHGDRKRAFEKNWQKVRKQALGMEDDEDDEELNSKNEPAKEDEAFRTKLGERKLQVLHRELDELLDAPFVPRGMSVRYPTKSEAIMEQLLTSTSANALKDVHTRLGKGKKREPEERKSKAEMIREKKNKKKKERKQRKIRKLKDKQKEDAEPKKAEPEKK